MYIYSDLQYLSLSLESQPRAGIYLKNIINY